MEKISREILLSLIKAYQWTISPFLGSCCRFHPTCSSYAIEAIQKHGMWRGCFLMFRRICRCHPWHQGGVDWVPD